MRNFCLSLHPGRMPPTSTSAPPTDPRVSTSAAEFLADFDALAGDADADALLGDPGPQVGVVVGLVGVQLAGLTSTWSAAGLHRGNGHHQRLERGGVVGVSRPRSRPRAARRSVRTGRGSSSRACLGPRGWDWSTIPLLARAAAPSTMARDQSNSLWLPISSSHRFSAPSALVCVVVFLLRCRDVGEMFDRPFLQRT